VTVGTTSEIVTATVSVSEPESSSSTEMETSAVPSSEKVQSKLPPDAVVV
jgi:hypothetical protein